MGVSADYVISPQLTLQAGANVILMDMEDGRNVPAPGAINDAETDLLNLYLGLAYKINDGLYVTGSYNWTDSDSDLPGRDLRAQSSFHRPKNRVLIQAIWLIIFQPLKCYTLSGFFIYKVVFLNKVNYNLCLRCYSRLQHAHIPPRYFDISYILNL